MKKKILGAAMAVVMSVVTAGTVYAAPEELDVREELVEDTSAVTSTYPKSITRIIGGYYVTASSQVSQSTGYAGTISTSTSVYNKVKATYRCVNTVGTSLETFTEYKTASGNIASVYFTAPSGYRTVKVTGDHETSINGEKWSANTEDIY